MKNLKLYLLSLLLSIFIISCGQTDEKKSKTEKVKVFISWPGAEALPHYSWLSNNTKPTGVEPTLIEEILTVANLEFEYVNNFQFSGNGDSRLEAITSGKADISIRGITVNEERKKIVLFSDVYYTDGLGAMVNRTSDINIVGDLKDKKVFVEEYATAHNWVKENLPEAELITFNNNNKFTTPEEMLLKGEIDAYIVDFTFLKSLEKKYDGLRVLDKKFTLEPLAIAISKDKPELKTKIDLAIKELKKSGRLKILVSGFEK